jgi:Transcriptional regulators
MADILREIGMIARALDSISNVEFQQYNLTKGQYLYLARICEHPGIIQEQLSKLIMVDRTTVIRAVQRLVDHQFVEKRPIQPTKKFAASTRQNGRVWSISARSPRRPTRPEPPSAA